MLHVYPVTICILDLNSHISFEPQLIRFIFAKTGRSIIRETKVISSVLRALDSILVQKPGEHIYIDAMKSASTHCRK